MATKQNESQPCTLGRRRAHGGRLAGALLVVCMVFGGGVAQGADPSPSPVGQWKTIDDNTHEAKSILEIFARDGRLFGKIVKLFRKAGEEQNPKCTKCPGNKKDQPLIGLVILEGLKPDGDQWSGGTILDPDNGKTYRCLIKVEKNGKLKVRGYMGVSLLGRTQYWHRVN